jgi:hypothetical protein
MQHRRTLWAQYKFLMLHQVVSYRTTKHWRTKHSIAFDLRVRLTEISADFFSSSINPPHTYNGWRRLSEICGRHATFRQMAALPHRHLHVIGLQVSWNGVDRTRSSLVTKYSNHQTTMKSHIIIWTLCLPCWQCRLQHYYGGFASKCLTELWRESGNTRKCMGLQHRCP